MFQADDTLSDRAIELGRLLLEDTEPQVRRAAAKALMTMCVPRNETPPPLSLPIPNSASEIGDPGKNPGRIQKGAAA